MDMGLIYVVEDDRDISEIESFALKNSGYDVQVYENMCHMISTGRCGSGCRVWCCLILCCPMRAGWR